MAAPTAPVIDPALAEAMADAQERRQRAAAPTTVSDAPRAYAMDDFLDDKAKASIALFKSEWAEVEAPVNALINAALQTQAVNMQREVPAGDAAAPGAGGVRSGSVARKRCTGRPCKLHTLTSRSLAALPAWIQKQPAILRPTLERVYNGEHGCREVVELLSAYKQAIGSTGAAPVAPASSAAQVTPRVAAVDKAVLAATWPARCTTQHQANLRDPNDADGWLHCGSVRLSNTDLTD